MGGRGVSGGVAFVWAIGIAASGCSQSSSGAASGPGAPAPPPSIVESDLVALVDSRLLVQNPARGLTALDVSQADRPLIAQVTSLTGSGGELYARGADAVVVFEEGAATPGQGELVSVRAVATAPVIGGRVALPGRLVRSRLVGDVVIAVSSAGDRAWVTTVSVADPARPVVVAQLPLADRAVEVLVTDHAAWIAHDHASTAGTRLQAVSVSAAGALTARGSILLTGAPRGRHHIDQRGATLRIVTFAGRAAGSNVFVIDAADLDRLVVMGSITGLAPGEDLHGTRFDGERLYVVTYQPGVVVRPRTSARTPILVGVGLFLILAIDPLWVVSLHDPRQPWIEGHLEVPGWSDWVFPRGDRLVCVGRGDRGDRVAISLFDTSDPTRPTELRRLEVGDPLASSEAATDVRGVRIVEAGALGPDPMVVLPLTNPRWTNGAYTPDHRLQLVDIQRHDLVRRGDVPLVGIGRRSLVVADRLYAVTDKTVAALDVGDRDRPRVLSTVTVGDINAPETPVPVLVAPPTVVRTGPGGCALTATSSSPPGALATLTLVALALALARHGRITASQRIRATCCFHSFSRPGTSSFPNTSR